MYENYLFSRFSNMRLFAQQLSTFELASLLGLTRSHHIVQARFMVPWRFNDKHGTYGTSEWDLLFGFMKNWSFMTSDKEDEHLVNLERHTCPLTLRYFTGH